MSFYINHEENCRLVADLEEHLLGPEHPNTLRSLSAMAMAFEDQGCYKEAEELYRRVLEAQERILYAKHPDCLTLWSCQCYF